MKDNFCHTEKCHDEGVLNLKVNKAQTVLVSLSKDNLKLWDLSECFYLKLCKEVRVRNSSFYTLDQLVSDSSDLKIPASNNLISFDSTENYLFLLEKNGANLTNLNEIETNLEKRSKNDYFNLNNLNNPTTLDIWNASHLCILIIGSMDGTLRIFKLLHQL